MNPALTILLVDDDADILAAMQAVFVRRGFRVLTAGDGHAAIVTGEQERPDIVVVDMMMPKKSGYMVLERLKSLPGKKPRVIMITANEGHRHQAYAEALGVDDYLRKPFGIDKLVEKVDNLPPAV